MMKERQLKSCFQILITDFYRVHSQVRKVLTDKTPKEFQQKKDTDFEKKKYDIQQESENNFEWHSSVKLSNSSCKFRNVALSKNYFKYVFNVSDF